MLLIGICFLAAQPPGVEVLQKQSYFTDMALKLAKHGMGANVINQETGTEYKSSILISLIAFSD